MSPRVRARRRLHVEILEARALLSAGRLDPTFGDGGRATVGFLGAVSSIAGDLVVVQDDGKVVVAGTASGPSDSDFAVARYNADGSLDPSFGIGGQVTTGILPGSIDQAAGVAVQDDGKVVVAGTASVPFAPFPGNVFAAVRYNADGSLDPTFGAGGVVTTPLNPSGFGQVAGLAVQDDGKVVVAGTAFNPFGPSPGNDFAVIRYNPDGSPDPTFGDGGRVTTDIRSGSIDQAAGVAVQDDGKVVVAGTASGAFGPDPNSLFSTVFAAVRYNADGTTDVGFGADGVVITDTGADSFEQAAGVAVQRDGRVIVAGSISGPIGPDPTSPFGVVFATLRYNADGTPDAGFGDGGIATIDVNPSGFEQAAGVAVQDDGKVVVGGTTSGPSGPIPDGNRFAVIRYNADGTPDAGFGGRGFVTTEIESLGLGQAAGVVVQDDGKVVLAGTASGPVFPGPVPTPSEFLLVRYDTDGALDEGFGRAGRVQTPFLATADATGQGVALQPDGKAVVVGTDRLGFAVARLDVDGVLDASFGAGGRVTTDISPTGLDVANAVALQPDGKIVVAGSADTIGLSPTPGSDFAVVRYNPDGSPDPTFGSGGIATVDFAGRGDEALGLTILADGRIILVGASRSFAGPTFGSDFALARLRADGSLDPTFGIGGLVLTDFAFNSEDVARGVAVLRDGRIVVAGSAAIPGGFGGSDIAVARYLPSGVLDRRFGRGGMVTTTFAFGTEDMGFGVLLQKHGGIVVAGSTASTPGAGDFALVGYRPDGRLDRAFGRRGMVRTGFGTNVALALAVAPRAHGRFVTAGTTIDPTTGAQSFALAGYLPDGRPDRRFGTSGRVVSAFDRGPAEARAVAVGRDGKVVAAGSAGTLGDRDFALARYEGGLPARPHAHRAPGPAARLALMARRMSTPR